MACVQQQSQLETTSVAS